MNINIEIIAHSKHRYETVGDWFFKIETIAFEDLGDGKGMQHVPRETLHIRVSKLSDWRLEALIAVHELVEGLLCKGDGVTQEQVDAFDMAYPKGLHCEPGDASGSPYRKQHCIATGIERLLAAELGVDWVKYEEELNSL